MEHVEALIKALGAILAAREVEETENNLKAYALIREDLERAQEQAIEGAAKDAINTL